MKVYLTEKRKAEKTEEKTETKSEGKKSKPSVE
jgi:hypothetical protein